MTKNELHNLVSNSKGNESNICQIYAFKNGKVIFDEHFKDYESDTPINVNSVTKGVMALLTGIAIDKGYIKSVDQKVMDFFPDYIPKRGEKTIYDVTIKHLLTICTTSTNMNQMSLTKKPYAIVSIPQRNINR